MVPPVASPLFSSFLQAFRPCFTTPSFRHFRAFVSNFWLGSGRRTVTAVCRQALGQRHFSCSHRFLKTYRWSCENVARCLAMFTLRAFRLAPGPEGKCTVNLVLDDTLTRHFGRKMEGVARQYDPMAPNPQAPLARGRCWVLLGLLHKGPDRWRCVPWAAWLFWPEKALGAPAQHETKLELAMRRLAELKLPHWLRLRLIADSAYGKSTVAQACSNWGWKLVSRLASNSVVYEPAPKPALRGRKRGRPKKYGEKHALSHFGAQARQASVREMQLYGRPTAVRYHAEQVLSRCLDGVRILLVAAVFENIHGDLSKPIYLFSTDLTLSAEEVIELYSARFAIEVTFRELKNLFGLGHCQARRATAAASHVQLCIVAHAWSQIQSILYAPVGVATPWRAAPLVASTEQLQADARRENQVETTIGICRAHGIHEKMLQQLRPALLAAA